MRILMLFVCLMASSARAHELWIEPEEFQPQALANIVSHVVNGEDFEGTQLIHLPHNSKRFVIISANQTVDVDSRIGDRPVINQAAPGSGLNIIVYETKPATISYETFQKFEKFAMNHGVSDIREQHLAIGLPADKFKEVYTRYSKALVSVGEARGGDRRTGLEAELVAMENAYLRDGSGDLPVRLFYGDGPLAGAQIELYAKSSSGKVTATIHQTNAEGIAMLPIMRGNIYMANAVIFRQPHERHRNTDAVWETLWANLTFAVPE